MKLARTLIRSIPASLTILLAAHSALAGTPVEVARCTSGAKTLSVTYSKKTFAVSLTESMTREKILALFPNSGLSEDMIALMMKQTPMNQIPADYREYSSIEATDSVIKNGFKLAGKNIELDLVPTEQGDLKILFRYARETRSSREIRSGAVPFGSIASTACEITGNIR